MHETRTEDVNESFSEDKEMFDFSNYSTESKYYHGSKKLVVDKTKYKAVGAAFKKFVGLNP